MARRKPVGPRYDHVVQEDGAEGEGDPDQLAGAPGGHVPTDLEVPGRG